MLFIKEIFLVSSNSRVSENLILVKINRFSFVLTIADREIIESSLSVKESRIFLIITIFNSDNIIIADFIKSFELFSSLSILLFLLNNTSNRVISSIEDSETIFTRRILYNIKKIFYNNNVR